MVASGHKETVMMHFRPNSHEQIREEGNGEKRTQTPKDN